MPASDKVFFCAAKLQVINVPAMPFRQRQSGAYAKLDNRNFTGKHEGMVIDEMLNGTFGILHVRPINEKWDLMASLGVGVYAPTTEFSEMRYTHLMGNASVGLKIGF